jgi:hypothetical protein
MSNIVEQITRLDLPKVEPLLLSEAVKLVADRLGLTVTLTSESVPEQYEITRNGAASGYIRVRWGGLSVAYPEAGDEGLYDGSVDGFGGFTDHEREAKMLLALGLIAARMMRA